MESMHTIIRNAGIIPVVTLDSPDQAILLAKALLQGGIRIVEITFRTEAAAKSIETISQNLPQMIVGAGTITSVEMAKRAIAAKAQFIVSPGFSEDVVSYCIQQGIPIYPGVANPSQIQQALAHSLSVVKFFPAEALGGVAMIDALSAPFPQISFMPTGGIGLHNIAQYIKRPNIVACGGSWMVKKELIQQGRWDEITLLSKEAIAATHGFSFAHLGINTTSEDEAKKVSSMLEVLLQPIQEGSSSFFASDFVEVTKKPFPGNNGHIGIATWSVERAIPYLKTFGFTPDESTVKYTKQGQMQVVYFKEQIGDFAIHLVKKS